MEGPRRQRCGPSIYLRRAAFFFAAFLALRGAFFAAFLFRVAAASFAVRLRLAFFPGIGLSGV